MPCSISRPDRLRVAALSDADPRTVASYFQGKRIVPSTARAIKTALAELGIPDPRAATTEVATHPSQAAEA